MTLEKRLAVDPVNGEVVVQRTLEDYLRAFDEAWRQCGAGTVHTSMMSRAQLAHRMALESLSREPLAQPSQEAIQDDDAVF